MVPNVLLIMRGFAADGPGRLVRTLLCALSPEDVRVSICALDADGPMRSAYHSESQRLGGALYTIDQLRGRSAAAAFGALGVDVIHAHLLRADQFGRRLSTRLRVPYAVTEHGIHSWGEKARVLRPAVREWYRRTLPSGARIVAVSRKVERDLLREGLPAASVEVIENAIDFAQFSPASAEARAEARRALHLPVDASPLILVMGSLIALKSPALAIEAMPAVLRELPGAHLMFAGEGALRGKLAALSLKRGMLHHITFLGQMPEGAGPLAAADLLLHPSQEESFCLSVAEALACGLPVVARAGSGADARLPPGECCVAVESNSADVWGRSIVHTWRAFEAAPPPAREELTTWARRRFDAERLASEHLALWKSMVA